MAAAAAGGFLNLAPSRAPTTSPYCPLFGTSYGWRSRRQLRLCPLLAASSVAAGEASYTEPEETLLEALVGVQGRGRAVAPRQLQEVESAVQNLEALEGVPDPTNSSLIEGRWKLIFTTRPGTASPIQRTFVGVDSFSVFQEVYLRTDDPRVVNVVKFSETVGELAVQGNLKLKIRMKYVEKLGSQKRSIGDHWTQAETQNVTQEAKFLPIYQHFEYREDWQEKTTTP